MKSFLILLFMLILNSCVSGDVPTMDRKVKIWNGAPEEIGICRMSTKHLAYKINGVEFLLKSYHKGSNAYECIGASTDEFKKYACLTFSDLAVINGYIEKLIYSCKKWD